MLLRVADLRVRVPAAVCDPGSIASVEDRLESSHQSAGRYNHFERFTVPLMGVGLAIRYQEKAASIQASLDLHCQTLSRPHGFRGLAQAGFIFRGVARLTEAFRQRHYFP